MLVTSWNLLHGMAIPPTNDLAADQVKLGEAIQAIGADVIGIQEVDEKLERSGNISQARLVGEAMGTNHWGFAAGLIGTPGYAWRAVNNSDVPIVVHSNTHSVDGSELVGGYGIGIVDRKSVV